MQYRHVCIESIAYALPGEIVTSGEVENALQPAYSRLRYEPGRFERVYGITERRFWPRGTLPGEISITTAERAIHEAGVRCEQIGAVVHTSVCRDGLQTATASRVQLELGLPAACMSYDVMNACLGFLNGMIQVANMIELGHIQAGVVVGTESSRALVETTIAQLNADVTLTRKSFKASLPSLSIGSGSVAAVLASDEISQTGNRLVGGKALADTSGFDLCVGSEDQAADENMAPLMTTDSHKLLSKGLEHRLSHSGSSWKHGFCRPAPDDGDRR